jgi:hypothetical protein
MMQRIVQIKALLYNYSPPAFLKWLSSRPCRMETLIARSLTSLLSDILLMHPAKQVIHDIYRVFMFMLVVVALLVR